MQMHAPLFARETSRERLLDARGPREGEERARERRRGEKRGNRRVRKGIEISDSNLNSAFERQPCSTAKQLEVGTVCAAWHKKTAEKWAPALSSTSTSSSSCSPSPTPPPPPIPACAPLWKNRFKLAPRVPKPRFKKLVKNCQRFSSFILFSPLLLPLPPAPSLSLAFLSSTANAPHASVLRPMLLFPRSQVYGLPCLSWFIPERPSMPRTLGAINIRD